MNIDEIREARECRKKALLSRLARVEGQVRAVRRMIDEDESCERIAQQLAASRTAMNKAFYEMMACAIEHEVDQEGTLDEKSLGKLNELTRLLARYG